MKEKDKLTILILCILILLIAVRLADPNDLFGDKTPTPNYPVPEEIATENPETTPTLLPILIIVNTVYANDREWVSPGGIVTYSGTFDPKEWHDLDSKVTILLKNNESIKVELNTDTANITLFPEILMNSQSLKEALDNFQLEPGEVLSILLDNGTIYVLNYSGKLFVSWK